MRSPVELVREGGRGAGRKGEEGRRGERKRGGKRRERGRMVEDRMCVCANVCVCRVCVCVCGYGRYQSMQETNECNQSQTVAREDWVRG